MHQSPKALMSFAYSDDNYEQGQLAHLRERLSKTLQFQTGEAFLIFQPHQDIQWGERPQDRIKAALAQVYLFIAVITPSYFNDNRCREELELFLERERSLGRDDLILPIRYLPTPRLDNPGDDPLAQALVGRQAFDWTNLRHVDLDSRHGKTTIEQMANHITAALNRATASPSRSQQMDDSVRGFIEFVRQQLGTAPQVDFNDVSRDAAHAAFPLIGFRETNFVMDLFALVPGDHLTHEEIIALRDQFFAITRRLPRVYNLRPGMRNPNGLLGFVFANGCPAQLATFIRKQTRISHGSFDGGVMVSWVLDMQTQSISPHNNPVSWIPPVYILVDMVFPGRGWLLTCLRAYHTKSG